MNTARSVAALLVALVVTGVCLTGCAVNEQRAAPESTPADGKQKPAPAPKLGDVRVNPKDGAEMVWVPAGEFLMGSTDEEIARLRKAHSAIKAEHVGDEKPQRKVYLEGYWMYRTEVTVAQYRKFCQEAFLEMSNEPDWGWAEDQPVVNVSWHDAVAYAKWAGVSLPTEAQWEKAARGRDGREYPWGGQWPPKEKVGNFWDESFARSLSGFAVALRAVMLSDCGVAPMRGYDDGYAFASPVGACRAGASPYGCLDMAGNAWEWCADWYDKAYYAKAPTKNPQGPVSGDGRVLRGGSWSYE